MKLFAIFTYALSLLSTTVATAATKPNIILIMADDMGYECVGANGSTDYKTPHLDKMAAEGARFTNCFANPLCTPSRNKIMTGMYNVQNYVQFRVLERQQKTFAHYLKDVGYRTCIAGKWQLGKEQDSPQHFGFEQSFLWQHTRGARREGTMIDSRHVNPRFERNGKPVDYDNGEFSSNLCVDFIDKFITTHKEEPFFVYYPMILPHCPFVPTPGTPDFDSKSKGSPTYKGDPKQFKHMIHHVDQMVAKIDARLQELGLKDNTIIIFTGDNGTDQPIKTKWNNRVVVGGKGKMTDEGTRVPFIVSAPRIKTPGMTVSHPIDFSDLLPTFCELANITPAKNIDGDSLLPLLKGAQRTKQHAFIWYERHKGNPAKAAVIARTASHQVKRIGKAGNFIYSISSSPYQHKTMKPSSFSAIDKSSFEKLEQVIAENDLKHRAAIPSTSP